MYAAPAYSLKPVVLSLLLSYLCICVIALCSRESDNAITGILNFHLKSFSVYPGVSELKFNLFLISDIRRVLNAVCFLLGCAPAYEV
jgi:hypothetical protein